MTHPTVIIYELELLQPRCLFSGVLNDNDGTISVASSNSPEPQQPDLSSKYSIGSIAATHHIIPSWREAAASKCNWIIPSSMKRNKTPPIPPHTSPPREIKEYCKDSATSSLSGPPPSPELKGFVGLGQQHKHGLAGLGATFKTESSRWYNLSEKWLLVGIAYVCLPFVSDTSCHISNGEVARGLLNVLFVAAFAYFLRDWLRGIFGPKKPQSGVSTIAEAQLDMSTIAGKQY